MTTVADLDTRPHSTVIRAAITAKLGPHAAYEYGESPGDPNNPDDDERVLPIPDIYVLTTVGRMYLPTLRMSAQSGVSGWRTTNRAAGRTTDECRWAMYQIERGLNEVRLTITGKTTTPLQFESSTEPESDDGRFSALVIHTYGF